MPWLTSGLEVVLVDDGSTDSTASLLDQLAGNVDRVWIHSLRTNSGKAEAVRQGLRVALDHEPDWVRFCDADMATPVSEILRLNDIATTTPGVSSLWLACRPARLQHPAIGGAPLPRSFFATVAATILGIPVYDTQCGAKFFRNTDSLRVALSEPFHSRWSFDVELLGRLLRGRDGVGPVAVEEFLEVPLKEWFDVPGSKIGVFVLVMAGLELGSIAHHLRRW